MELVKEILARSGGYQQGSLELGFDRSAGGGFYFIFLKRKGNFVEISNSLQCKTTAGLCLVAQPMQFGSEAGACERQMGEGEDNFQFLHK